MKRVYLIDGFGGSPKENWLEAEGQKVQSVFEVHKVQMTDFTKADVSIQDKDLEAGIKEAENAFFICHSLGCISLLRYLYHQQIRPLGCIFVSGFDQDILDFPEFNPFFEGVDVTLLSKSLPHSLVISAVNDSIVPSAYSQELARKLSIPFIELPEGNHFRASDSVLSLPVVSEFVKRYWVEQLQSVGALSSTQRRMCNRRITLQD